MESSYASPSILQYIYQPKGAEGHECGYCSGKDGNICNGMWLHTLSCEDYEELVDRGWRRCGQYGYKPIMNRTCCPLYAITCDALKFNLSKSQKTVLIKLRKYLETDSVKDPPTAPPPSQAESHEKCSSGKVAKAKREHAQEAPNRLDESMLTDVQPSDKPDPPLAEGKTSTKVPSQDSDDTRTKSNILDESMLTDVQPSDKPDPPLAEGKTSTKVPSQDGDDTRTKSNILDESMLTDVQPSDKPDPPLAEGKTSTKVPSQDGDDTRTKSNILDESMLTDVQPSDKPDPPLAEGKTSTEVPSQDGDDTRTKSNILDESMLTDVQPSDKPDPPLAEGKTSTEVPSQDGDDTRTKSNILDESMLTDIQPSDKPDPPLAEGKTSTEVPSQDGDDTRTKSTPVELPKKKKKKKAPAAGATAAAHKARVKKTVEDFISLDTPMTGKAHKLEVKLVQSAPRTKEFDETFAASYALYKQYQMVIHNDKEEDCSEEQYTRFLVDSPLQRTPTGGTGPALGSYHQQYYLDGKLVMVGVVDLLPRYVSSVYVFYDPAIMFLSPGVVSALYEIAYTRQLHALTPSVAVYCLGYYVHNCQKMRYKGQYRPSFLLCPETYRWQPIEKCVPKLDRSKYARLEEEEGHALEPVEDYLDRVYIWNGVKNPRAYGSYRGKTSRQTALVKEYATLVGSCVSTRAILYCH